MEKTIEIGLLFDYYGNMLTDKQQQALKLYYYHDLSLGEIAEKLDISRQGVYDHLHRGEDILRDYEEKIGLINRYNKMKKKINKLVNYIDETDISAEETEKIKKRIDEIKKFL